VTSTSPSFIANFPAVPRAVRGTNVRQGELLRTAAGRLRSFDIESGRKDAPRQGPEGAPEAWLEIEPQFAEALLGVEVGPRTDRHHVVAPREA